MCYFLHFTLKSFFCNSCLHASLKLSKADSVVYLLTFHVKCAIIRDLGCFLSLGGFSRGEIQGWRRHRWKVE